jgi:hypothetical protein
MPINCSHVEITVVQDAKALLTNKNKKDASILFIIKNNKK